MAERRTHLYKQFSWRVYYKSSGAMGGIVIYHEDL